MSLLVESFIFDRIECNFLIVGHTHSSIDQYFSVLSGAIKSTTFIGSPLSLMNLLSVAHSGENIDCRPTVCRQISVYYDIVKALTPFINPIIKVFIYLFYYYIVFIVAIILILNNL
jgi:hypothetical protein